MRLEHRNGQRKGYTYPKFQFHKGAIRTITNLSQPLTHRHFNSIKVRLEPDDEYIDDVINVISIP